MSDEPKAGPEKADAEPVTATTAEPPTAAESAADTTVDVFADLGNDEATPEESRPDMIETLQSEIADLKDRLLRAAAEMENMRRRFEREMADARQYAVTGFAREVLSIGDNLGRALEAVPEQAKSEDGPIKGLLEGVEMTERELLRVLNKHNVQRLEPHGQKFDPHYHQAIFEVEHKEVPHGTVVQVIQHGYSIGERVLRPAMVGVAKAQPKPSPGAAQVTVQTAPSSARSATQSESEETTADPSAADSDPSKNDAD